MTTPARRFNQIKNGFESQQDRYDFARIVAEIALAHLQRETAEQVIERTQEIIRESRRAGVAYA